MIDWVIVVAIFLAAIAGGVGGSARPGDRLRDIPEVFMRRPVNFVAYGLAASLVYVVVQITRNG